MNAAVMTLEDFESVTLAYSEQATARRDTRAGTAWDPLAICPQHWYALLRHRPRGSDGHIRSVGMPPGSLLYHGVTFHTNDLDRCFFCRA
jgi:hypothetical protein